jgi:hypothetical protein
LDALVTTNQRVLPRIQGHIDALREAGLDTESFFEALVGIRDDRALGDAQRNALYRLLANESFVWYLESLRGKPIDRIKLAEQAAIIAEENAVAIKKRSPGDLAAQILERVLAETK